jgi:hypothetical protein
MKAYAQEVQGFIAANVKGRSRQELAELTNAKFGTEFTASKMNAYLKNHNLRSGVPPGGRRGPSKMYQPEVQAFIQKNHKGITTAVIAKMVNDAFGTSYTAGQIKSYLGNHGLKNGVVCRFVKGQVSHNKGKKGYCSPGCEKSWFQMGHSPHNHRPVGSERVDSLDGYTYVKIAEPKTWRMKHHLVWEAANGPVPDGYILIFKDGDKGNITVGNLALVTRAEHLELTRSGLRTDNADLTGTGILISRVKVTSRKLQKNRNRRDDAHMEETKRSPGTQGEPTSEDLALINKFRRRGMNASEFYVFSARLCDNEIDRDGERFTTECLQGLRELFIGKTGSFDRSGNTPMRIYDTYVEIDPARENILGEPYAALYAKVYMHRTEENAELIGEIDAGLEKEVSVSCSVKSVTCSVCGKPYGREGCMHTRGENYGGGACHVVLNGPTEAFEFSFSMRPASEPPPVCDKIKPCGFCYNSNPNGNHGLVVGEINLPTDRFAVHCRQCGAYGPREATQEQAITAWNDCFGGEEQEEGDT